MRAFFRRLMVRNKLFILLALALLGLIVLSIVSSLWLASQNTLQHQYNVLLPPLYEAEGQNRTSAQWQTYFNTQQSFFTLHRVARYDQNGSLLDSTHQDVPNTLDAKSLKSIPVSYSLLAGPNYSLIVDIEPHLLRTYVSETLMICAFLLAVGALLIYAILYVVDRLVTRPIRSLNDTTNEIAIEQNYALRAKHFYPDEIGTLAENFNFMLNRVEQHEQLLRTEKERAEQASRRAIELSQKMHDKTAEAKRTNEKLHESNEKLAFEVKVRARIERKVTELQKFLNNIINSMPSAIIAINEELVINQWNKGASELTGFKRESALDNHVTQACGFLAPYRDLIVQSLEQKKLNKIERIAYDNNETSRLLDITIYPLLETTTPGAVLRIDDITQRAQMEDMMVQSEKMMSLGGLAAGMAHEINNPLGAIIHTVQNIQRRLNAMIKKNQDTALALDTDIQTIRAYIAERDIFAFLDNITEAGTRASTIVSNMLQFSRQSTKNLQPQNLHQIIDRAINIARNEYSLASGYDFKSIDLIRDFDLNMPDVPCIPSEIEQVLLNLLKNAAYALKDYANTKEFDLDWYAQIQVHTQVKHDMAEIRVEDNGPGMNEQTRKQIFEPFFTTKEVGAGTGLGLSVSYFILTSHHQGNMLVSSTPGQGTCFTLQIPLSASEQASPPPALLST